MLTRDKLTVVQGRSVRTAPHHIVLAVSAVGGSVLDEVLERNAGLQGIVDGMHSTHPLVRDIANTEQIKEAQHEIRAWCDTLADSERIPAFLQEKAVQTLEQALETLGSLGDKDDLLHYGEFVMATASCVARAAREGDVFGIGGELVSRGERQFLQRLYDLNKARQR